MIITLRGVLKSELYKVLKILDIKGTDMYLHIEEWIWYEDWLLSIWTSYKQNEIFEDIWQIKSKTKLTWKLVFRKYSTTTDNYNQIQKHSSAVGIGSSDDSISPDPVVVRWLVVIVAFCSCRSHFVFLLALRCSFRLTFGLRHVCVKPEACFC